MAMNPADSQSAEVEHREHRYVGNAIPWYVHVLWLVFWIFALSYIFTYLVPAMRREILAPP